MSNDGPAPRPAFFANCYSGKYNRVGSYWRPLFYKSISRQWPVALGCLLLVKVAFGPTNTQSLSAISPIFSIGQSHQRIRSSCSICGSVNLFFMQRAGLRVTMQYGATSRNTTDRAPMMAPSSSWTPARMVATQCISHVMGWFTRSYDFSQFW